MLSDKNHINLGNYEEYFILYMDNELNAEERLMVDAFLSAHPDLQAEMDMLVGTKLPSEDVSFSGKEELMSHNMKMEAVDHSLLFYIDNEVHPLEKERIEQQLKTDKVYQQEYDLLMQTKLDASEVIRYPNKKELYRHKEKVVVFKLWMKVAAAVIVILFASLMFLLNSGSSKHPVRAAINNPSTKENNSAPIKETAVPVNHSGQDVAKQQQTNKETPTQKTIQKEKIVTNQPSQQNLAINNNNNNHDNVPVVTPKNIQIDPIEIGKKKNSDNSIADITSIKDRINNANVTNEIPGTSSITEDNGSHDVANNDEPTEKGSFKGFLRKATRVIERKAGITAANDDNEVLIGAVAVKLK